MILSLAAVMQIVGWVVLFPALFVTWVGVKGFVDPSLHHELRWRLGVIGSGAGVVSFLCLWAAGLVRVTA